MWSACARVSSAHRPPNCHETSLLYTRQCAVWNSRSEKEEKIQTKIPFKVHILATARGQALQTSPASSFYEVDSLLLLLAYGLSWEHHVMCLCAVAKHCVVIFERVSRQDYHLNSSVSDVCSFSTCHNNMQYFCPELFVSDFALPIGTSSVLAVTSQWSSVTTYDTWKS